MARVVTFIDNEALSNPPVNVGGSMCSDILKTGRKVTGCTEGTGLVQP